jgi:hypothetical protein
MKQTIYLPIEISEKKREIKTYRSGEVYLEIHFSTNVTMSKTMLSQMSKYTGNDFHKLVKENLKKLIDDKNAEIAKITPKRSMSNDRISVSYQSNKSFKVCFDVTTNDINIAKNDVMNAKLSTY